jgi:hypothetical protein
VCRLINAGKHYRSLDGTNGKAVHAPLAKCLVAGARPLCVYREKGPCRLALPVVFTHTGTPADGPVIPSYGPQLFDTKRKESFALSAPDLPVLQPAAWRRRKRIMQKLTCPRCGSRLGVPSKLLGRNVPCPKCGNTFAALAKNSASVDQDQSTLKEKEIRTPPPLPQFLQDGEQPQTGDFQGFQRDSLAAQESARDRDPIRTGGQHRSAGLGSRFSRKWIWIWGIVGIVLIGSIIDLFFDLGGGEIEAKVTAESFVQRSLKAPATAKFPSANEYVATRLDRQTWKVTGYVDAQNSFGAMLRSHWTVTLRYEGRRNWTCLNCVFD